MDFVRSVTDLADQAIAVPLICLVAAALLVQRRWALAGTWLLAMGAVSGSVLVLKVTASACGWRVPLLGPGQLDLHSPSGHTAAAAAIAGGLAALIIPGHRRVVLAVSFAAGLVIGTSRLLLGVHSVAEVITGGIIGMSGALLLSYLFGRVRFRAAPVLLAVLLAVVVFHGQHLPAEAVIQGRGAMLLRTMLPVCVLPAATESAIQQPSRHPV